MKLQSIVFPKNRLEEKQELYYNITGDAAIKEKTVVLQKDAEIDFGTYFNAFFYDSWKNYTEICDVAFECNIEGSCIFELHRYQINGNEKGDNCVMRYEVTHPSLSHERVKIPNGGGAYYIKVKTLNYTVKLQDMCFTTPLKPLSAIRIAMVICTYRREPYVLKNTRLIADEVLKNASSPLCNDLDVYIIDNGRTLNSDQFPDEHITLYANKNLGGTGGFTRGMVEALKQTKEKKYSHILLMDDDIDLEPETLERTYAVLSLLKDNYKKAFLGGAMLRNDTPHIQEEAGAVWSWKIQSIGKGRDLRKLSEVAAGLNDPKANYNAWWYCCIPITTISPDNLPMPFFIHGDDIEYGLRNCQNLILLNGICVWHDTFEHKRASSAEYYDVRNYLIINSIYRPRRELHKIILGLLKRFTANIMRMRYMDVQLGFDGIIDFLKGPMWWEKQDICKIHEAVSAKGYLYEPYHIKEIPCPHIQTNDTGKNSFLSIITLNGALLPKKRETLIVPCGIAPYVFYRIKKAYLVDPSCDKAVKVEFSFKQIVILYGRMFRLFCILEKNYKKKGREYRQHVRNLGSSQYWKTYFK